MMPMGLSGIRSVSVLGDSTHEDKLGLEKDTLRSRSRSSLGTSSKSAWKLPAKFKLLPGKRLEPQTMAAVDFTVARLHCKMWFLARGIIPPAAALHPAVMQLIADWFDAVDEDGSRTLEHSELLAALKAAHIPCNDLTITEMIKLMDVNGDGVISWDEFRMFMADEFSAGKNLMTGEYMLPSGATMNFGVVIGKLKRDKLMKDVLEDLEVRSKWARVAADPAKMAKEVSNMTAASKAAAEINNALEKEMVSHIDNPDDVKVLTPRTQAAASFLGSISHEARLVRSLSRAASRRDPPSYSGPCLPSPLYQGTADGTVGTGGAGGGAGGLGRGLRSHVSTALTHRMSRNGNVRQSHSGGALGGGMEEDWEGGGDQRPAPGDWYEHGHVWSSSQVPPLHMHAPFSPGVGAGAGAQGHRGVLHRQRSVVAPPSPDPTRAYAAAGARGAALPTTLHAVCLGDRSASARQGPPARPTVV